METITQIVESDDLAAVMDIPAPMRHARLEVTLRLLSEIHENDVPVRPSAWSPVPKINQELLEKFRNGFTGIKDQIRKKAAEGYHFDFDVQKYLNGSMTEDDWQQFYKMEKQAWGSHVKDMADMGKYGQTQTNP
ncbi:hypothetical protein AGMMS49991_11360 [Spirochaetia bacterium]|nr:hypothetical protein AGMMS49991_11360 [Spirochaetia bacterium]